MINQLVQGTYNSHYEATEPDPYIVDLNAELVQSDEFMAIHLPTKERKCVRFLHHSIEFN
jgi:exocyst complex component 4